MSFPLYGRGILYEYLYKYKYEEKVITWNTGETWHTSMSTKSLDPVGCASIEIEVCHVFTSVPSYDFLLVLNLNEFVPLCFAINSC